MGRPGTRPARLPSPHPGRHHQRSRSGKARPRQSERWYPLSNHEDEAALIEFNLTQRRKDRKEIQSAFPLPAFAFLREIQLFLTRACSMNRSSSLSLLAAGAMFVLASSVAAQDTFSAKIRPFLDAHCTDCHG